MCALPNSAASPAPGSFDQASYQSLSELLPLPVVCSSLLTFVSCHSLKWRISKSQPQRPEQCNIRRRDVSLLRISKKHPALLRLRVRVLTSTQLAPLSLHDVFTGSGVAVHARFANINALTELPGIIILVSLCNARVAHSCTQLLANKMRGR